MNVLNYLLGLGPAVMLPIVIFVLGVAMGTPLRKAFKSGLLIGVGFTGINLVIGLLVGELGPAAHAMLERLNLELNIIDIGWPAMASISWAWSGAAIMIPVFIAINFLMLTLNMTKTMNVDVWNFWQFSFIGSAVHFVTGNLWIGMFAAALAAVLSLVMADYTAPLVEKFFGLKGISLPHLTALGFLPIVMPLNWLLDKVPGINKLYASPESIQKRFGVFGEPIVMGLFIGLGLGFLAGYEFGEVLKLGVAMAAVMYLMPKVVAILMEGLIPISNAAKAFMAKRFGEREIYIGLDAAVALGDPAVIAVGLILVPITLLLAFIIPINKVLPFADLAVIPFLVCLVTAMTKGNVIRAIMIGTVVMGMVLVIATNIAPIQTAMAMNAGVGIPEGAAMIANFDRANFITWMFIKAFSFLG